MTWSKLWQHTIDYIINDEHNRIIIVVLAKLPDDGSFVNRNMLEQLSEF
jgi:hypothetical protein